MDMLLNVHRTDPPGGAGGAHAWQLQPAPGPTAASTRASSAPSWAIYFGERRHAVTLHWMVAEVDAGQIAYEAELRRGRPTPA